MLATPIETTDTTTMVVIESDTTGSSVIMMEQVSGLKVYPNPAHNLATIVYSLEKDAQLQFAIVDMTGRIVMQKEMEKQFSGFNSFNIDLTELKKGVYFVKLNSATFTKTTKLIVR